MKTDNEMRDLARDEFAGDDLQIDIDADVAYDATREPYRAWVQAWVFIDWEPPEGIIRDYGEMELVSKETK